MIDLCVKYSNFFFFFFFFFFFTCRVRQRRHESVCASGPSDKESPKDLGPGAAGWCRRKQNPSVFWFSNELGAPDARQSDTSWRAELFFLFFFFSGWKSPSLTSDTPSKRYPPHRQSVTAIIASGIAEEGGVYISIETRGEVFFYLFVLFVCFVYFVQVLYSTCMHAR